MSGWYPPAVEDPAADQWTRPFWEAALDGRLVAAACRRCGTVLLPPRPVCHECQHDHFDWVDLPGTGTIYTFTVVRHALTPALTDVVPYVAAVVELDGTQGAGARLVLNVVGCEPEEVRIGDLVQVFFEPVNDVLAVPRARRLEP
jgi:uncharacterized OB-fold protein